MGLRDWYIDLMYRPPEEKDGTPDTNAAARVEIPWGKRYVQVFICAEFMEYRPERQRQFVVHELLHCHFDHLDSLTQNELRDHVGEIYWQAWHPGFWLMFENTIDAIANAWAEKLPVISWPKPPPKAAPRRKGKRG
jgi:hypothetical protein